MKFTLWLTVLMVCGVIGCKNNQPQNDAAVRMDISQKKALAAEPTTFRIPEPEVAEAPVAATLSFSGVAKTLTSTQVPTDPNMPLGMITNGTKFAAVCPYCGKVNSSKSCLPECGVTTNNGVMQNWVISFKCRKCTMDFNDFRKQ